MEFTHEPCFSKVCCSKFIVHVSLKGFYNKRLLFFFFRTLTNVRALLELLKEHRGKMYVGMNIADDSEVLDGVSTLNLF